MLEDLRIPGRYTIAEVGVLLEGKTGFAYGVRREARLRVHLVGITPRMGELQ